MHTGRPKPDPGDRIKNPIQQSRHFCCREVQAGIAVARSNPWSEPSIARIARIATATRCGFRGQRSPLPSIRTGGKYSWKRLRRIFRIRQIHRHPRRHRKQSRRRSEIRRINDRNRTPTMRLMIHHCFPNRANSKLRTPYSIHALKWGTSPSEAFWVCNPIATGKFR